MPESDEPKAPPQLNVHCAVIKLEHGIIPVIDAIRRRHCTILQAQDLRVNCKGHSLRWRAD